MGKTVKPLENQIDNTKVIEKLREDNLRCLCGRILLYCEEISCARFIIKCPSCGQMIRYYIGFEISS